MTRSEFRSMARDVRSLRRLSGAYSAELYLRALALKSGLRIAQIVKRLACR